MNPHAIQVIDALGGTAATARTFKLSMPSVSDWKKNGIPEARMMFLRATRLQELQGIDLDAATSPRCAADKDCSRATQSETEPVQAGDGADA